WVLKKAPAGWHRVVIEAEGFVPRVLGYLNTDDQPRWHRYDGGLARPAIVAGRVTDDPGKPLPDAHAQISGVTTSTGSPSEPPRGYTFKTGRDGRFRTDQVPVGTATIWVHKPGYCRPELGLPPIKTPKEDVKLTMIRAGRIVVTMNFGGKVRPEGYIVSIQPEGGERVGKYGGVGAQKQNKRKVPSKA